MDFIVRNSKSNEKVTRKNKKGKKSICSPSTKECNVDGSKENSVPKNFIIYNNVKTSRIGDTGFVHNDNSFIVPILNPSDWAPVDKWVPGTRDIVFKSVDKAVILPVSEYYGFPEPTSLDNFIISPKRCYNKPKLRKHLTHYLNYFEKFYDTNRELLAIMFQIKYFLDFREDYGKTEFISDLNKYIICNESLLSKIRRMNENNYSLDLGNKKGKSVESLQYNTVHGKLLMQMSLIMLMIIPLACHFIHVNGIDGVDTSLLEIFDNVICMDKNIDMYSKLYETAYSEISRSVKVNKVLWEMNVIRGFNPNIHTNGAIENIILNIMPKYTYDDNCVVLNYISIKKSTGYKITDIKYEYEYFQISSSNRDEDFNSDMDKFESYLIRQDEALYLQAKVTAEETMKHIEEQYGPFDPEEIKFYDEALSNGTNGNIINEFQKNLIFNMFYKYFGDPVSIQGINKIDYIKLMIAARKILESYNMVILPYVISSKVIRIPNRKNINKRENLKIKADPLWEMIQEKYKSPKIEQEILVQIATILSGEFKIVDYKDDDLNGRIIDINNDIIIEEFLLYINLI